MEEELRNKFKKMNENTMIDDYISLSINYMKMKKMGFNMNGSEGLIDYHRQIVIESGCDINKIDNFIKNNISV